MKTKKTIVTLLLVFFISSSLLSGELTVTTDSGEKHIITELESETTIGKFKEKIGSILNLEASDVKFELFDRSNKQKFVNVYLDDFRPLSDIGLPWGSEEYEIKVSENVWSITVKMISNPPFLIKDLKPDDTVLKLKEKIYSNEGHHIDSQRIIFNGKDLLNNFTLKDANLFNNAQVHLVVSLEPVKIEPLVGEEKISIVVKIKGAEEAPEKEIVIEDLLLDNSFEYLAVKIGQQEEDLSLKEREFIFQGENQPFDKTLRGAGVSNNATVVFALKKPIDKPDALDPISDKESKIKKYGPWLAAALVGSAVTIAAIIKLKKMFAQKARKKKREEKARLKKQLDKGLVEKDDQLEGAGGFVS